MEEFKLIFEGLDIAYGQHRSEGKRADGKQEGKSYIVKKLITEELWKAHLDGEGPSLGIIPIRADTLPSGAALILIVILLIIIK